MALYKKHIRILTHLLFWGIVLIFYTYFYGHTYDDYHTTFLFVCLLLPITIATTYFVNYYLIPKYLLKKKYKLFVLYAIYAWIFSVYFELIVVFLAYVIFADLNITKMNPLTKDIFFLMVGLYFVVFFAVAVKMLKNWYKIQKNNQELAKEMLEAELKLTEAELKVLKGQIHPHFLFNTLNNLYGLTLAKSDAAPRMVLLISSLLDYLLYQCNTPEVKLKNEIDHIFNYLELEKIRYGAHVEVKFVTHGQVTDQKIAPMLLLPFVENSFKHGVRHAVNHGFIDIKLRVDGNELYFTIKNSKIGFRKSPDDYSSQGIGLHNVKKRLELIYGEQHRLIIEDMDKTYQCALYIALHKRKDYMNTSRDSLRISPGKSGSL